LAAICTSATLLNADSAVREKSSECIMKVLDPSFVQNWDGSSKSIFSASQSSEGGASSEIKMQNYWRVTSHVLATIAKTLGEVQYEKLNPNSAIDGGSILVLLETILCDRNRLLVSMVSSARGAISFSANTPERVSTIAALEEVFLIFACCSDFGLTKRSLNCLRLLLEESEIVGEVKFDGDDVSSTLLSNSVVENSNAYMEIEKILLEEDAGQKGFQKRIRAMLRLAKRPTDGNMAAWDDIYRRWKVMKISMTTPSTQFSSIDELDSSSRRKGKIPSKSAASIPISFTGFPDDRGDWLNYTGFLCALGGACIADGGPNIPPRQASKSGASEVEHTASVIRDMKIKVGHGS
jgi:hypothetical protein